MAVERKLAYSCEQSSPYFFVLCSHLILFLKSKLSVVGRSVFTRIRKLSFNSHFCLYFLSFRERSQGCCCPKTFVGRPFAFCIHCRNFFRFTVFSRFFSPVCVCKICFV